MTPRFSQLNSIDRCSRFCCFGIGEFRLCLVRKKFSKEEKELEEGGREGKEELLYG